MRINRLHLKLVIRNVEKEPRDACARGFFMPESQGINLNLIVNNVYNNVLYVVRCKNSNNLGKCANKVVK